MRERVNNNNNCTQLHYASLIGFSMCTVRTNIPPPYTPRYAAPESALYKLKKKSSPESQSIKFSIVKVHTSLSFSYNCSNDTDSGFHTAPDKVTLCNVCAIVFAMMIIVIKYYIKLVLSCSRHRFRMDMHFTNVLPSAYTIHIFITIHL